MAERQKHILLITGAAALFFLPFLGGVHLFDWDEINFAEISREMLETKEYLRVYVNYIPFWEKPPLFFWLQAASMKLFGVGEYAARFPNAICGIATLLILYLIGEKLYNRKFGLIWAGAYFGSILPHLYFKSGIIDPWFNLFIFLGLYFFILFYWKKEGFEGITIKRSKWAYLILGGFILGLGVLTKGPVAYLIVGLTLGVFWVLKRFKFFVGPHHFIVYTLAMLVAAAVWYGLETMRNGPWFVTEFTVYQYRLFSTPDAGHKGFPGYHFVVLLLGCFPSSIFAIRGMMKIEQEASHHKDFRRWMIVLFWVVLILFTIVKSKIVHYSSMAYFPLTYLATLVIYQMIEGKIHMRAWFKWVIGVFGAIMVLAPIAGTYVGMNIEKLKPLFKDPFAQASLNANVNWTGLEVLPGIFMLGVLIAFFVFIRRNQLANAFKVLFPGMAIYLMLGLVFFVGRAEAYSQRAYIDFVEELQGKDVYVTTYGFKSYAQLFYFRVPMPEDFDPAAIPSEGQETSFYTRLESDPAHLLWGAIDKDAYIICRIMKKDKLLEIEGVELLYEQNGFAFFKREAVE